jgi:hypothetical protein
MSSGLPRLGRRRGGGRKRERHVGIFDTADLLRMLKCDDVDTLLVKLDAARVAPHITGGPGGSRLVFVSGYQLPDGLLTVRV